MVKFILLALLMLAGLARAETVAPDDASISVKTETLAQAPFEQEMVLITVRGQYFLPITLEELVHPEIADFGWMQLGRDRWRDEVINGRTLRVFERSLALFPKKRGRLVVPPFVHRLTLLGSDGKRFLHEIQSAPLAIDVARKPQGTQWWLPARGITIKDAWTSPPDAMIFGGAAERTITLTAKGVGPEMLPTAPKMAGHGLIAFQGPEDRSVELTPEGPISTVVWRWTVRMLSPDTGPLETASIGWFDAVSRTPQIISFAPQRVALASAVTAAPTPEKAVAGFRHAGLLAALAGLAIGLALILPGWRLKSWPALARPVRQFIARRAFRRALRRADMREAWRLARRDNHPSTDELAARLFGRPSPGSPERRWHGAS